MSKVDHLNKVLRKTEKSVFSLVITLFKKKCKKKTWFHEFG